ncbi:RNA polymerase sigma factor [Actinoplanes sp. L3-i22]|uniref:RNA polymerase sigma factor n=1 Tax=Actinoplanes sp. L3-i22 TaxID=2836373 RepID=UPI001C856D10|nr:sigma-70 family RNA polymerase sigma factor [Actinoplanes sp. L3-i22]
MRREQTDTALVVAARAGDQRALDELIAAYLPLLYNVAGRALSGHADVDDVVQETMIRMVRGLPGLREPQRFRSWLIAIAVREIRDSVAARQASAGRAGPIEDAAEAADPGADFADLTILRLGLSGERRRVAEATRWLDQADRELLALWWLEAAGEIDRAELAVAIGLSLAHTAVRVQRMRAQLDAARAVTGALDERPRCPQLAEEVSGWDGVPGGRWRKRIARHTRDCVRCHGAWTGQIPAERLLAGLGLVPAPKLLVAALSGQLLAPAGGAVAGAAAGGTSVVVKLILGVAAAGVVAAGGLVVVRENRPEAQKAPQAPVVVSSEPAAVATASATASPSAVAGPRYGQVVDVVDAAPPKDRRPATLPRRPAGTLRIADSADNDPRPEVISLVHRGERVTLSGRGYLRAEWQVPFQVRAGAIVTPAWSGLRGKLFHVASGGGHRMDDPIPGEAPGHTFLGNPQQGTSTLVTGVQQFWASEYYYLDGTVTLTQRESGGDYNLYVHLVDRQTIVDDITTAPAAGGAVRYGLTRDTGTDAAPVPQFVTRGADPALARRQSRV